MPIESLSVSPVAKFETASQRTQDFLLRVADPEQTKIPSVDSMLREAAARTSVDGILAVTIPVAAASGLVVVPAEIGIAEALSKTPTGVEVPVFMAAAGLTAVANAVSVEIGARALKKEKFSANPIGTLINVATEKPRMATLIDHVYDGLQLSIVTDAIAVANNDLKLGIGGIIGGFAASATWNTAMNSLIASGRIDPVLEKVHKAREKIVSLVKHQSKRKAIDIEQGKEIDLTGK